MAYTVQHLYEMVLEGTDKMGSDLFTIPYVLKRLKPATYDFIGETVKYIENNAEIRDDIRTLYKPFKKEIVVDPLDLDYKAVVMESDYLHYMSVKVIDANVPVVKTRIIRHGQEEIFLADPDTMPLADYPMVVIYDNVFRILSPGNPTFLTGFYVKKPTFGFNTTDIAVNLPDNATDKIIKTIISDIFVSTGDPRAGIQAQSKETYRQR